MKTIDRKLLRDLFSLKGQVVTIAFVVACGICAYVTMQSNWRSLASSRDRYYAEQNFAEVFAKLERAPVSLLERVSALPGVARIEDRVVEAGRIPVEGMMEPATAHFVSVPDGGVAGLNTLRVRAGRRPDPEHPREAVVIEPFARAHALEPGDELEVVLGGKSQKLRIVGTGLSPEFTFLFRGGIDIAPDDRKVGVIWMSRSALAQAVEMEGAFNDLSLRLQPGASEAQVIAGLDALLDDYGGFGAYARADQPSHFFIVNELKGLRQSATVVPLIFLAVAAFLLNVVLSRLIFLQRQQIATFKAVGYSNARIALHYLELVTVIVAIGAAIGVALGAYFGLQLLDLYADYFRFPSLEYTVDLDVVAVATLVSLASGVVGAIVTVRRVAAMKPAEAMRPPAPLRYSRGLWDRLGIGQYLGTSATMVVRELTRRPIRLALSSLAIAAAVSIMIVGRFASDSFDRLIDVVYQRENRADVEMTFAAPLDGGAIHELEALPGVLMAEGMRALPVRVSSGPRYRDSVVLGIPATSALRQVVDRSGNAVTLPGDGIALSAMLASVLDVDIGDTVAVELREGERRTLRVPISGLVDDAFGLQGYMTLQAMHRLLREEVSVSTAMLLTDSSQREDLLRRAKELPMIAAVSQRHDIVRRFREQTASMMAVMAVILSVFGGAIAVGVVYNNARVALSLRQRDFASLRILGFRRGEVSAILLGELTAQLLIGIPLGLVLGKWLAAAIMTSAADPEMYRLATVIAPRTYLFAAGVTLVAGALSALLVRRRLDRLDLVEVLKTNE